MSTQITFLQETIKRGSGIPQGQRSTIDYDPSRGFHYSNSYKGISQQQLIALQQNIIQQGIACRLELYEDIGELHTDDSTSEYTIDSWEIAGSDLNDDGLSHPTLQTLADNNDAGDNLFPALRASLENNDSTDDVFAYLITDPYNYSEDDARTIVRFYGLQQKGSTAFEVAQYSLIHKTNVSNRWAQNVSDVGVKQIYTPAQLLTEVTDPALWIYPLPPRLQFKLGAIPVPDPQSHYLWGWLKSTSTESNVANNRVDISTNYVLSLWSTDYYTPFNGVYGSTPYY